MLTAALLILLGAADGGVALVPADANFARAAERPRDPLTAKLPERDAELIRQGYRLFVDTPHAGAPRVQAAVSCANCHLNAGQKERALPLVAVAGAYPELNKRSGRPFTLEERIIGCLLRSCDAANAPAKLEGDRHENAKGPALIPSDAKEVRALAAYLRWLSEGFAPGPWRGKNELSPAAQIPIAQLDLKKGEALYLAQCALCHAADGQGAHLGEVNPGPLWGPRSWNDGAGMARVYTLAGYLRWAMPYLAPGSLSDEEAQLIAAYLDSKPRPPFPDKDRDYQTAPLPPDAVYYPPRKKSDAGMQPAK